MTFCFKMFMSILFGRILYQISYSFGLLLSVFCARQRSCSSKKCAKFDDGNFVLGDDTRECCATGNVNRSWRAFSVSLKRLLDKHLILARRRITKRSKAGEFTVEEHALTCWYFQMVTKKLKILITDNFFSCHLMVMKLCKAIELENI